MLLRMVALTERTSWRKPRQLTGGRTQDLTSDEIVNVKKAIRVLRVRHGGIAALAAILGVNAATLRQAAARKRPPSVGLALRAARLAGVPLEDILGGSWPRPGACPHCGRL